MNSDPACDRPGRSSERACSAQGRSARSTRDHRAHVAQIRPQYDTIAVCGSVIHKYVALVVGLGPEAGSPGRTARDQPPSRPPMALSGAPGAASSTRWPVGPSAEHLERLQVLIEPSLTVSAKPHFLDLERALGVSPGAKLHNRRAES